MIFLRALLDAHKWRPRSALPPAPRPLTLHVVAGGGCNGCLVETQALQGAAYDLARHDIRFVETPLDAELLFVTGVVTRAMLPALQARWAAMPSPKGVVAIGDCALGAGPFATNYAVLGGIMEAGLAGMQRCDVALRGCPPAPEDILRALLVLTTGRVVTA
ncbi:NADH-quinone oxidoreductase subunit B family protein [Asaia krungthepensis]|uniref:NADH-ubiquinone oxidoreductase 20 kDa subunit n=1 Tax=Asaia krungthepensis NRIC 0535 TaxID=1307925 RepID=A0ABQ0PYV8_9PROT|nr:NADH-quinone oxidoreductase subunit B [Asaia krungthepensis]GBQ85029.1 NADH-ubiquinone oxidoreductase 20 kDa subunit [Asaia krungthepensis NRIC 0535]